MIALLIPPVILVVTYFAVYALAARERGYRLCSRRRGRGLISGRVECVGGPFDGVDLPASRADLLGLWCAEWPDVLYDAEARTYRIAPHVPHLGAFDRRAIWAGYYALRFMGDRYEWHGTGLEQFATLPAA